MLIQIREKKGSDNKQSGFTLIELLTVIAIIGILAAILIPVVGAAREAAWNSQCISKLRSMNSALSVYTLEHDGRLASPNWGPDDENRLRPYILVLEEYQGPMEAEGMTCPTAFREAGGQRSEIQRTYGYNGQIRRGANYMVEGDIVDPSHTVQLMDGSIAWREPDPFWFFGVGPEGTRRPKTGASRREHSDFIHNGKVNMVFFDGHVESRGNAEIPTNAGNNFWYPLGREEPEYPGQG